MSTIYNFEDEVASLVTGAASDITIIRDASAGRMKRTTLGNLATRIFGEDAADTVGFYGVTAVAQKTFTATALTAVATTTVSAANTSTVFGFASSTAAAALVKRAAQAQADLESLMARIDSVGLVAIAGVP
jgi:hypothetical protein